MKKILNRKACCLLFGMLLSGFVFFSCDDGEEKFTAVDLRYNPKDSYLVTASSPEDILFEVKSNLPWEVFGKGDWHTITPSTGGPDSIYRVTVKIKENTALDDRTDTIIVKSDYWVGKRFTITQKGIAWLSIDKGDTTFSKEVERKTFSVKSNQDWTCEVTTGSEWLSVVSGATGKIDGEVTVETKINKGELRKGVVTAFDRHHVPAATITFVQNGVLLMPEVELLKESHKGHVVSFEVESNTDWVIEQSEYDVWFEITSGTAYNGNATVNIRLDANTGVSLRKTEINFKTVSSEVGVEPVMKTIILKQAPLPAPEHHEFDAAFKGSWNDWEGTYTYADGDVTWEGSKARAYMWIERLGTHSFRIKEMSVGSMPQIYFMDGWGNPEVRFHLNTTAGTTDVSQTGSVEGAGIIGKNIPLDVTKPHTLNITLSDVNGKMKYEMSLDDEEPFAYTIATNVASTNKIRAIVGAAPGRCVHDWYEYTPPVDWGD